MTKAPHLIIFVVPPAGPYVRQQSVPSLTGHNEGLSLPCLLF
jgi:hypothetical protein